MNVLEMMQKDISSVINKTVCYEHGLITGNVVYTKHSQQQCKIDDTDSLLDVY